MKTLEQRIDKTDTCWLWTGPFDRDGYGRFNYGQLAHRLVYEQVVGPIPPGLTLDHLCRVRHCVNPEHLEAVTREENLRRGIDARRPPGCPSLTHCKRGHLLDEDNTYWEQSRYSTRMLQKCRTCAQESNQRRRAA